jgi:hypothetical protein
MKSFLIVAALSVLAFAIQARGADPIREFEAGRCAMSTPTNDHGDGPQHWRSRGGGAQPNDAATKSTNARTRADSCSRGGYTA